MVNLWQLFLLFLKVNLLTTSGPASVGLLYKEAVGTLMDEGQFVEAVGFSSVLPGSDALTFGMLGCDFRCSYCQNWDISQTLRDDAAGRDYIPISAGELVELGRRYRARGMASTYNEPLITSEWAVEVFKLARAAGMLTMYVSNGNGTREVIDFLTPWIDAY